MIAEGQAKREIAQQVILSDKTVKNYVSNILSKLEESDKRQGAMYMAERRVRDGE